MPARRFQCRYFQSVLDSHRLFLPFPVFVIKILGFLTGRLHVTRQPCRDVDVPLGSKGCFSSPHCALWEHSENKKLFPGGKWRSLLLFIPAGSGYMNKGCRKVGWCCRQLTGISFIDFGYLGSCFLPQFHGQDSSLCARIYKKLKLLGECQRVYFKDFRANWFVLTDYLPCVYCKRNMQIT